MLPLDNPLFWGLAVVGVVLTGVSKSGFAGGAGVVAVPLLALVIPVQQAAALLLPLLLVMDARTVALYRSALSDWRGLIHIGIAALAGIAIAGSAMGSFSQQGLQIFLALFCIAFALWERLRPLLGKLPGAAYLWGTLSGVTSTLLHAGGPPISIYFLSRNTEKSLWLAQAAVFFAFMNIIKIIPYSINNLWDNRLVVLSLILIPVAMEGMQLGYHLQKRMSQQQFTDYCRWLLLLSGILLLTKSFT